ncbi:MAG TPA: hypothetical protein DD438_06970 [Verrucomicrobiales bacterium]|nr:hypothetical protein [Verrucomicrobiales bacterium]
MVWKRSFREQAYLPLRTGTSGQGALCENTPRITAEEGLEAYKKLNSKGQRMLRWEVGCE